MAESPDLVEYQRKGRIAYLTLNRPDKLNAFSDDSVIALRDRLFQFDGDDDAWVAIVSGRGRAFSSGADVRQRQLRHADELKALGGPSGRGANAHTLLYEGFVNWKPVIAAVHGYAMGMALGLALRCDLAVADADTQFQATEISRGLYAGQYWSLMQGRGAGTFADEVFLTGRKFSGREAAENGLITRAVEDQRHVEAAEEYASAILANPPLSVRAMVRTRRWHLQQNEMIHPLLGASWKLHLTEDFHESALAFAEKRPPREFHAR